jgi:hypothetical protein
MDTSLIESNRLQRIEKNINYAILITVVVLLIFVRVYKVDSCDLCKPFINDSTQDRVVTDYINNCLKKTPEITQQNFSFSNINITRVT